MSGQSIVRQGFSVAVTAVAVTWLIGFLSFGLKTSMPLWAAVVSPDEYGVSGSGVTIHGSFVSWQGYRNQLIISAVNEMFQAAWSFFLPCVLWAAARIKFRDRLTSRARVVALAAVAATVAMAWEYVPIAVFASEVLTSRGTLTVLLLLISWLSAWLAFILFEGLFSVIRKTFNQPAPETT